MSTPTPLTETEVRSLVADFAHDLLNPIQAIRMSVTYLQSSAGAQVNLPRLLHNIFISAQKLQEIADEAMETSLGYQDSTTFSTRQVLDEAIATMRLFAPQSENYFSVSQISDFNVSGSKKAVYRALTNLLKNAVGAVGRSERAGSEGKVRFTLQTEGISSGTVGVLFVEDNGVGLSPEQLPLIWGKGYTKSGTSGHGLGMGIIKQVFCEQLKGTVAVSSVLGTGTDFSIRIPISTQK